MGTEELGVSETPSWTARLVAAGWYEGRTVDIGPLVDLFAQSGVDTWPQLLQFLSEFDRLRFWPTRRERTNPFDIHAAYGMAGTDRQLLDELISAAGVGLAPVGEYGDLGIFLGRDGSVYGQFGDTFGRIGLTLEDAVVTTLEPGPFRGLPVLPSAATEI